MKIKKFFNHFFIPVILIVFYTIPKLYMDGRLEYGFKKCFHSEGLFDKTGKEFIFPFLFEFPIAAARWTVNMGMLPLAAILLIWAIIINIRSSHEN